MMGRKPRKKIDWDIMLLGQMSDTEIAVELGVNRVLVHQERKRRGIPRYLRGRLTMDDLRSDPRLGEDPIVVIAKRHDVPLSRVIQTIRDKGIQRRFNWDREHRLGKMTDKKLGEILGVSSSAVRHQRQKRGIPCCGRKIDWDTVGLGQQFDADIARGIGKTVQEVRYARQKRGIRGKVGSTGPTPPLRRTFASAATKLKGRYSEGAKCMLIVRDLTHSPHSITEMMAHYSITRQATYRYLRIIRSVVGIEVKVEGRAYSISRDDLSRWLRPKRKKGQR